MPAGDPGGNFAASGGYGGNYPGAGGSSVGSVGNPGGGNSMASPGTLGWGMGAPGGNFGAGVNNNPGNRAGPGMGVGSGNNYGSSYQTGWNNPVITPASYTSLVPVPKPKPPQALPWGGVNVLDPYRGAPPPPATPAAGGDWPPAYGSGAYGYPLSPGEMGSSNGLGFGGSGNWNNINSPNYGQGNPMGGYGSVGNPGGYGSNFANGGWIGHTGPAVRVPRYVLPGTGPGAGQGGMGAQNPTGQGTNPGGNPNAPGGWNAGPTGFADGGMVGGLRAMFAPGGMDRGGMRPMGPMGSMRQMPVRAAQPDRVMKMGGQPQHMVNRPQMPGQAPVGQPAPMSRPMSMPWSGGSIPSPLGGLNQGFR